MVEEEVLPGTQSGTATASQSVSELPQEPAFWRELLKQHAASQLLPGVVNLITSVGAYLALSLAMYFIARDVSIYLTLALAPVSAAFLLRTFIVFHDCSHGSFFASRRANNWVGMFCGLLVLSPFARWRHDHAVHHATSGDLDKRGIGDLPTLTVEEYWSRTPRSRLAYRTFRNPAVMFGLGPLIAMIIGPRMVAKDAPRRLRNSVLATDAVLAAVTVILIWAIGIDDLLLVWAPAALLAGSAGIWLFYVQHQFEDAYWERGDDWSYADAALRGSSFLKLPQPLQFATGNIGYHHIHHLSVKIPCYRLPQAHEQNEIFHSVPVLTLRDGLRAVRLKLWDESNGRLVTFAEADALRSHIRVRPEIATAAAP